MSDESTKEQPPAFEYERPGFDVTKHPIYRKLKNLPPLPPPTPAQAEAKPAEAASPTLKPADGGPAR